MTSEIVIRTQPWWTPGPSSSWADQKYCLFPGAGAAQHVQTALEAIFYLHNNQSGIMFLFWNFQKLFLAWSCPEWNTVMTKAQLQPYKQSETLWSLLEGSGSDQRSPSKAAALRSAVFGDCHRTTDPGLNPIPQGSALCLLRSCKDIWNESSTALEGNFSQVPCTDASHLCACKCACAMENALGMLLS